MWIATRADFEKKQLKKFFERQNKKKRQDKDIFIPKRKSIHERARAQPNIDLSLKSKNWNVKWSYTSLFFILLESGAGLFRIVYQRQNPGRRGLAGMTLNTNVCL